VAKIQGSFCERSVHGKQSFDPRSFRWVHSGRAWILVGCPHGKFTRGRCRVGLRAYKVLAPRARCKRGEKRIRKG
jgi:hypothetical protein